MKDITKRLSKSKGYFPLAFRRCNRHNHAPTFDGLARLVMRAGAPLLFRVRRSRGGCQRSKDNQEEASCLN